MNKNSIRLATAIAAILAAPIVTATETGVELGAGVTYVMFDDDFNVADDIGYRGLLGYRVNERFGMELVLDGISTETDPLGLSFDMRQLYVSGLYHFNVETNVQPYVSLGWGQNSMELADSSFDNDTTATNLGAGIKWYLKDNLILRPAINYFMNTEYDEDFTTVGLTLSWVVGGGSSAAPKAKAPVAPADSDNDGVTDSSDTCPATPAGVGVSANGCPLDTDNDGVSDYLDKCPNTAAKLKVDSNGCPVKLSETVSIDLNVNFDSNSDVVKPAYYGEIGRVAEFLQQYVGTSVVIEGHTDTSGSASYNKNLSQRRADSVAAVLVQQMGVSQARVSAMGYGEEQPIADESTATGREANRRVVAKVSAKVESMEEK